MKKLILASVLLLLLGGNAAGQSSLLSVTVQYENGDISIRQISTYEGYKPVLQPDSGNYSVEIVDSNGDIVEERRFEFSRTAYVEDEGQIQLNETSKELVFENSQDFNRIIVRSSGEKLLTEKLNLDDDFEQIEEKNSTNNSNQSKNENKISENSSNIPMIPIIGVLLIISATGIYVVLN